MPKNRESRSMKPLHSKSDLPSRVKKTIMQHRMIHRGTGVIVGVSGGPDSTALLHILAMLQNDLGFRIAAAHMDHSLRSESGLDAEFVIDMAEKLGIEAQVKKVDTQALAATLGVSVEEAGRGARYQFFEDVRKSLGAETIATAHHRDDELETFFLRIFRGSSIKGLGGIPPKRGRIIRPLITLSRSEILEFLKENNISYRVDRTNLESRTDRNFIRNQLIPIIRKRFPNFGTPLKRTMELIKLEDDFLENQVARLYEDKMFLNAGSLTMDLSLLRDVPEVLAARLILRGLHELFGAELRWRQSHLCGLLAMIRSDNPSITLDLPDGLKLIREYNRVSISRQHEKQASAVSSRVILGPGKVEMPNTKGALEFQIIPMTQFHPEEISDQKKAFFDADVVQFPLILRPPRPGDRFQPWGMQGTRKLKNLFIDLKVPLRVRRQMLILVKDDEILWIPGIRRGSAAPICDTTHSMLVVTLISRTDAA